MDIRKLVGRNIRRLREDARLSQEELAHRVGLDRTYVGGIGRGQRNPTVLVLEQLAETLGVELWVLFETPDEMLERLKPRN